MLQIDATFLVIFFIVWILVFLLSRIFWKPLVKLMSDRESGVQSDWAESRKSFETYEQSLQEIARRLKEANAKAEEIREELIADAAKERARLVGEAGAACRAEIEKAKTRLAGETRQLRRELEADAARLAAEIEKRLLS
jgi:F-type H+-transporting ATPase subunit b